MVSQEFFLNSSKKLSLLITRSSDFCTVFTDAERGYPSISDISPKNSPSFNIARTVPAPLIPETNTFTKPLAIRKAAGALYYLSLEQLHPYHSVYTWQFQQKGPMLIIKR
jgi:hypothetical protein|tara:strand:- start:555 stop:884 length:330 start_codon:yes stop_codon:yes gene_type:complete